MGIKYQIVKSTLGDVNKKPNWRIYADFAQLLISQAKKLYKNGALDMECESNIYAIDVTTIDLCLQVFPWEKFRNTKGVIKLHTKINIQGNIPKFINISNCKLNDVNALDYIIPKPKVFYLFDVLILILKD